jgi:AraC-like DNA-binding protein
MVTMVRAAALSHFSDVMHALGGDPDKALREQDQLLDVAIVARLLEGAAQATGCESFGLRMARSRQLSSFGAVSLLLLHQPTLRHALDTLIAHMHLVNESLLIHLEDADGIVILREDFMVQGAMRQSVELATGVLWRMCEALLRERWRPQGVSFTHAPPADLSMHRSLFRCRITFGAEFNGIVCRTADLDEPNPLADPALARYALRLVEAMPAHRAASVGQQTRKAIYLLLPSGNATCAGVAQGMGRSMRTLQRELEREGLNFSDLLGEIRHDLALRYLDHPHYSVGQVAAMLGYASHSAFTRWFAARFGCAPEAWRHQPRAPAPA